MVCSFYKPQNIFLLLHTHTHLEREKKNPRWIYLFSFAIIVQWWLHSLPLLRWRSPVFVCLSCPNFFRFMQSRMNVIYWSPSNVCVCACLDVWRIQWIYIASHKPIYIRLWFLLAVLRSARLQDQDQFYSSSFSSPFSFFSIFLLLLFVRFISCISLAVFYGIFSIRVFFHLR